MIRTLEGFTAGKVKPDLTLLLDIDVEKGLKRASTGKTADRMEKRGVEFHRKVRQGYLSMAEQDPGRIKVITVRDDIEETYDEIREKAYGFIRGHKGAG